MPDKIHTPKTAAKRIGSTEKQLAKLRRQGGGPTFVLMSCGGARGRPRYRESDLDSWIANLTEYKTNSEVALKEAGGAS